MYIECTLITLTSLSTFLLSPWAANSRASSKVAQPVNNLKKELMRLTLHTAEFRGSYRFLSVIKGPGLWSNRMGL